MKVLIKENGEERVIKEGNLAEIKEHIINELDNLLDWLDETENNWDNFAELKNNIKEEIENADSVEDLEQAFDKINAEMSWWGVYFE
jgi:hypothetical protein